MNPNLILVKDQDSIILNYKDKIRNLIVSPEGNIFVNIIIPYVLASLVSFDTHGALLKEISIIDRGLEPPWDCVIGTHTIHFFL